MKKPIRHVLRGLLLLFSLNTLNAFPQSWESIKNNKDYICGEGHGSTVADADKFALINLISQIITNVSSETHYGLDSKNRNGQLDETSQFTLSANTYSQATLTNTTQVIIHNEPEAHVGRWIKRTEVAKIFESRKKKAIDLVESALRAEEKGKVDDVLRNYYWALTLLKSLQYPNDVVYVDNNQKSHILTNWVKEKMDEAFEELKAGVVKRDGDDVELLITYKGKPVNSVDYTYFDGASWSNIYSAKDGKGVLELAPNNVSSNIQLKYEYEYYGEARIDSEIESVLNAVKGTPMPNAYINIESKIVKRPVIVKNETFTSTNALNISAPKTIDQDSQYITIIEEFVKSVKNKDELSAKHLFTDVGWMMYKKLIKYGKPRVLDSPDIRFYKSNGKVVERGLRMSFSFISGIRKSFVEDVVMQFNKDYKICNVAFGLGKTAEDDILNKGTWDENTRFAIMDFLENYKTAYALKRIDYIQSVFDDDAVIITGSVINRAPNAVNVENRAHISSEGNQIIRYNRQTKDQYLKNLSRCFARNEFVNIRFSNNDVTKYGQGGELYAIQIAQDYYSSTYGDKGYLFLMVDINNPNQPLIKVRTWQPEKDPNFGLYGPGDF